MNTNTNETETTIECEVNMETGEAKTKAPWGDSVINLNVMASLIKTGLTQLVFYKNDGRVPSEGLLKDIEGYEAILNSKDPNHNTDKFMDIKHEGLRSGKRHEHNLAIVDLIKENGDWK